MTSISRLIRAGILGAAGPALALLCITLPGLLINILLPILYLGVVVAIAGSTAGLLTARFWQRHAPTVAAILGAVGVCGSFAAAFWLIGIQSRISIRVNPIPWQVVYPLVQFGGNIASQGLVLGLLVWIRWLVRKSGLTNNSLRQ